jgi:hypothetical protein
MHPEGSVMTQEQLPKEQMSFTPGPWHWDSDPVKGDPLGRVRYRVVALGKTITQVYYSTYEGGLTNAEADARLIAAAPAMYEALQLLLPGLILDRRYADGDADIDALNSRIETIISALDKANGHE